MLQHIRFFIIEDGGNPRFESDIQQQDNGFWIHPFCEDESGFYRFRLNVRIENDSTQTISVPVTIEWGDQQGQEYRRFVLLSQGDEEWRIFQAEIEGTEAKAVVEAPPGTSYLSMHPRYEYGRYLQYLEGLDQNRFEIKVLGKSRRGREIHAIEAGNKAAPPLAVLTRVHPYETIGSYMVEGMLEWLKVENEEVRQFLANNRLLFIPMPNPDGVADGNCKFTHSSFNFSTTGRITKEPEGVAVREYLLSEKAVSLVDLHGWMLYHDNICTNDTQRGRKLYAMLSQHDNLFNKGIEMLYKKYPWVGRENNLGGMLVDEFDSVYYNTSWCWYDRSADDVQQMGVHIMRSYSQLFDSRVRGGSE
ncbi:M14 family zinc carboxypeptidase [Paenibacillus koleovorans]|uniref:M14 family zinc carboxypeptidase n=1 Tax=Paenibacillus koleovorans TaxID=121608 RepID=UPI000FDC9FAE|nr:M14 family zinc carboxypeptidase [Paenibacillus koleovorans]